MYNPSGNAQVDYYHNYALQRLQAGFSPPIVVNELVQQGLPAKAANGLVSSIRGSKFRKKSAKGDKARNRWNGVGKILLGICMVIIGGAYFAFTANVKTPRRLSAYMLIAIGTGVLLAITGVAQMIMGFDDDDDD